MSAHWNGDTHPPEVDSSVTAWAERLEAMSASRRAAVTANYSPARLPWIRLVLDSVAARGTLGSLVRAAMGSPARPRGRR